MPGSAPAFLRGARRAAAAIAPDREWRPACLRFSSCDLPYLLVPEMAVSWALGEKLVVTAEAGDAAALKHKDLVRLREHRQAMRDDDHRPPLRDPPEAAPDDY